MMKFAMKFAIFVALVSLNLVTESRASECKDFVKKMLVDQMKFVVPCITKLGLVKPQEKKENVFCIMRCVLQDAKMLAADGNVDFDLVNKVLEGIPPALKEKADKVFNECGHFAASLDPSEKTCTSYGPLLTCLTDISVKICA